jgi:hypothetical protein
VTNTDRCVWCGRGIVQAAQGRPRKYCRRSHRQRAYEARLLAERMGLGTGEALVSSEALRGLNDRLYALETALTDVERDLRTDGDHKAAFTHLYAAAAQLRDANLEPQAVLEA